MSTAKTSLRHLRAYNPPVPPAPSWRDLFDHKLSKWRHGHNYEYPKVLYVGLEEYGLFKRMIDEESFLVAVSESDLRALGNHHAEYAGVKVIRTLLATHWEFYA